MSWSKLHEVSENYACDADVARWRGDADVARANYVAAARWEERALKEIGSDDPETYGITAVSAAALFYKGKEFAEAEKVAREALAAHWLPKFAKEQLDEIIEAVGLDRAKVDNLLQWLVRFIGRIEWLSSSFESSYKRFTLLIMALLIELIDWSRLLQTRIDKEALSEENIGRIGYLFLAMYIVSELLHLVRLKYKRDLSKDK
jgi:hypothetical protein